MATKSKAQENKDEQVVAGGARNTSVEAARENDRRNADMLNATAPDSPGSAINEFGTMEVQESEKVPAPSGEPPIPLAPGNFDNRAFSFDETVPASPRMIAPAPPVVGQAPMNVRTVEQADLDSVGFKALVQQAQMAVDSMILRPGDQVAGAVDVYPCDDVSDGARITLLPGAIVPDEARAFFPANYMSDTKRRALSGEARKVGEAARR
jgi:hypothetical protein